MKNALREGGAADLNLYSVGFESGPGELHSSALVRMSREIYLRV
jgi:hypothetical protein